MQSPRPPVLIGGWGKTRTPRLAARFADEFNVPFPRLADVGPQVDAVRAACEAAERDPATMRWSAALVLCCGEDEDAYRRRAAAIGRDPDELRTNGAAGTVAEVVETLGRYADAGMERIYLQVLDLHDLDHLRLIAAEVAPGRVERPAGRSNWGWLSGHMPDDRPQLERLVTVSRGWPARRARRSCAG